MKPVHLKVKLMTKTIEFPLPPVFHQCVENGFVVSVADEVGGEGRLPTQEELDRLGQVLNGCCFPRLLSPTEMVIPAVMDSEMEWILGRPNFWCAAVASVLRLDGMEIKTKVEAEQAAVIHWMLQLRSAHGDKWQDVLQSEHDRMKANYAALKEQHAKEV